MRVLVCGDRNWADEVYLREKLYEFDEIHGIDTVIEGDAAGADRMAGSWAQENSVPFLVFPAQWDIYGRAAGPIRNTQMLTEGRPDYVLAFHENIEFSRGTKNMVNQAKNAGIPYKIYLGY
ncbi:MAG: DUF2493 domain-containing protein [Nitrosomonadales bacterium]|nr:MAG: DUF2493 domain-containing protein [Nitrosomonadales bacterium]